MPQQRRNAKPPSRQAAKPPSRQAAAKRTTRRRGEGTVYLHVASGRYAAQLSAGTNPDGTRRRLTVYGATEAEVLDERDRLRAELRLGRRADARTESQRVTVGEWLDRWLGLKRRLRPRTLALYRLLIDRHLKPALGTLPLAEVRPSDVLRLLADLEATEPRGTKSRRPGFATRRVATGGAPTAEPSAVLSASTIHHCLRLLRAALDVAVDDELLTRNPARARSIRLPRLPAPRNRPLEDDQAGAFFAVASSHRLYALWVLAAYHGLRRGELLGLRWADVDQRQGRLRVRQQLEAIVKGVGEPVLNPPKSEAGQREVRLSETARAGLAAHRRRQLEEIGRASAAGLPWAEHGLVFCTELGKPLFARNVVRAYKSLLRRAGLPLDLHIHDLRHTAGTAMAVEGIDPATIAEVLGHADKGFTAKTYLHALNVSRDAAADAAERRLGRRVASDE
jgi:integrase